MMRESPPNDASVCPRAKRSNPSTLSPRFASWYAAALPCAPSPATIASYLRSLTTRSAGDGHRDEVGDLLGLLTSGFDAFDAAALQSRADRVLDRAARVALSEVLEHQRDGSDRSDRARDALARVLRRRAMDRLEHRHLTGVDVPRRGDAEPSADRGAEVGDDVAEQVRGHDRVELLRLQHEPHAGRVDVHRVARDIAVLLADLVEDPSPELLHRDRVRLVDEREVPIRARARELEGVADDALDARARESHRHLGDLVLAGAGDPAGLPVYVFGVLADDDEIDVLGALALQRHEAVVVRDDGAEVHVQVETPPHAQDDVPFDDAARRARVADGPEQDGVEGAQSVDVLGRDATCGIDITRRGPAQFLAQRGRVEAPLGGVQDTERRAGDLGADAVAADDGESVWG